MIVELRMYPPLIGCAYHGPDQPSGEKQLHAHDDERGRQAENQVAGQDIQNKVGQSEQTSA